MQGEGIERRLPPVVPASLQDDNPAVGAHGWGVLQPHGPSAWNWQIDGRKSYNLELTTPDPEIPASRCGP